MACLFPGLYSVDRHTLSRNHCVNPYHDEKVLRKRKYLLLKENEKYIHTLMPNGYHRQKKDQRLVYRQFELPRQIHQAPFVHVPDPG